MIRRCLFRVLLSLLLLLSQQMAIAHAVSHWSGTLGGQAGVSADADKSAPSSFAQDPVCDKCLVFAQVTGGVGSPAYRFSAATALSYALASGVARTDGIGAVVPFHSRAPPATV